MSGVNPEFPDFIANEADTAFPLQAYAENLQHLPQQLQFDVLDFRTELDARNTTTIAAEPADTDMTIATGFNRTVVTPERLWLEALQQGGAPITLNPNFIASSQTVVSYHPQHADWFNLVTMHYDQTRFPMRESTLLDVANVIAKQGDYRDVACSPQLSKTALIGLYPEQSDRDKLIHRVAMSSLVAKVAMTAQIMQVRNIQDHELDHYDTLGGDGYKPFSIAEQQALVDPAALRTLHMLPPYTTEPDL